MQKSVKSMERKKHLCLWNSLPGTFPANPAQHRQTKHPPEEEEEKKSK